MLFLSLCYTIGLMSTEKNCLTKIIFDHTFSTLTLNIFIVETSGIGCPTKLLEITPTNTKPNVTCINGTKIKDKISSKSMLIKFGLLSVNQLAAKIKLKNPAVVAWR